EAALLVLGLGLGGCRAVVSRDEELAPAAGHLRKKRERALEDQLGLLLREEVARAVDPLDVHVIGLLAPAVVQRLADRVGGAPQKARGHREPVVVPLTPEQRPKLVQEE